MDYTALGKRVKLQRVMAGITQEELAEKTGVSCSFIGHIERGEKKASVETLVSLCNAMRITPTVLLQDSLEEEIAHAENGGKLAQDIMRVMREHNVLDII